MADQETKKSQQRDEAGASGQEVESGAPASSGARSLGAWLRTQREARGVTVEEIAEASKISRRYLEALESDRFDVLPAPVFVRGFLREYARIVGLDADEVVNLYLLARPSVPRDRGVAAANARRNSAPRGRGTSIWGYVILVVVLLAVFLGIAVGISWWAGRDAARSAAEEAGGVEEVVAQTAVATEEASPPADGDAAAPLTPPAEETREPAPLLPSAAGAVEPSSAPLRVVLEFQQDCWVEVVVDGRRRESELKAGGETLALEAQDYVELTLGNAPAVRLEVNGQATPIGVPGSRVVRSMRIDRQGLRVIPAPVVGPEQ